jgi:hypothetical protein
MQMQSLRLAIFAVVGALVVGSTAPAVASEYPTFDVLLSQRPHAQVLFLSAEVVQALEVALQEARMRSLPSECRSRYAISIEPNVFVVSMAPPYKGGLDGPEFRVVIDRSNFSVRDVKNDCPGR